ncbi:hypothetical protein [Vreelandella venusta]|uniref:hypothetical protein n=1 Tax=Vreelandella venusta TaxID=44935 RepID=UPI001169A563|nr:hypothetical protein [Halomonas venusta]GEK52390.1 hypothetical protein HVE01_31110 [Halomonas venusta]
MKFSPLTLLVLKENAIKVKEILNTDHIFTTEISIQTPNSPTYYLNEFGVDDTLINSSSFLLQLKEHGIAYNLEWESMGHIKEGRRILRFMPNGDPIFKALSSEDDRILIDELLNCGSDLHALQELIFNRDQKRSILPWTNQVEYGQRYRTVKLITP